MGTNQHVTRRGNQWAVVGEGNQKATSLHSTQEEAIGAAKEIAINQQAELLIHGRNNQIRERSSYGNDPHPPRG